MCEECTSINRWFQNSLLVTFLSLTSSWCHLPLLSRSVCNYHALFFFLQVYWKAPKLYACNTSSQHPIMAYRSSPSLPLVLQTPSRLIVIAQQIRTHNNFTRARWFCNASTGISKLSMWGEITTCTHAGMRPFHQYSQQVKAMWDDISLSCDPNFKVLDTQMPQNKFLAAGRIPPLSIY